MATSAGVLERVNTSVARGFLRKLPTSVWIVALLAALLHIAPFWRAESVTPPGWTFTGNLNDSIDFIQYRAWMRQSMVIGPFVDNRFTSEPNRPHLPVFFYYLLGKIAGWGYWQPETVFAYAGCVLAFALVLLLFATVRHFLREAHRVWWVFLILLLGGGLGSYYKLLGRFAAVRNNPLGKRLIVEPIWDPSQLVFEDYRGHYIFTTLFDTHYLLIWLTTTAAVVSLYFALRRPSAIGMGTVASLYGLATILHIYEAGTLIAITGAVAFFCWRKKLPVFQAKWVFLTGPLSAATALAFLLILQHSSGIPLPTWREVTVVASMLFMAYPLAWIVVAWGLGDFWRNAELEGCFLLGWAVACTVITLSGPFFPYPDRGTMTLEIPLYLIAGLIYFFYHPRVTRVAAVCAVLLTGATPAWAVLKTWNFVQFSSEAPWMFSDAEHREIVGILSHRASVTDILLAPEQDVLWLAPEYPGKHYCAHFFLTVGYERKKEEVEHFFATEPEQQAAFLRSKRIRYVFVPARQEPSRFERVPGLVLLKAESFGSLFQFTYTNARADEAGGTG